MADESPSLVAPLELPPMDRWAIHRPNIGLLIVETVNFIVYITKDESDVHWETTEEHDAWLKQRKLSPSDCQSRISYLESLPTEQFRGETKTAFRCQLAEAMVFFLRGQDVKSERTLELARAYYVARSQEYARRTYVCFSAAAALLVSLASFAFRYINLREGWGWTDLAIIYVGVGSSMGALLFSLTRMSKTSIDPDAESKSHIVEAFGRIIVSLIVGVIAVCAVRGGFLLPEVIKEGYGFFLLCTLAGASERFGGAIVEHFEQLFVRGLSPSRATIPKKRKAQKRTGKGGIH